MRDIPRFRRFGRAWHPRLDDRESLAALLELDDTLWMATAAPVSAFAADTAFLHLLDTDKDGRIGVDDVRAAIRVWLASGQGFETPPAMVVALRLELLPEAMRSTAQLVAAHAGSLDAGFITLFGLRAFRADAEAQAGGQAAQPADRLLELEALLLYQIWLLRFVRSFASCEDLYEPDRTPLFGWGSLVLAGRRFNLAIKVDDAERHEGFARRGAVAVMYVQVGGGQNAWDYEVAVPLTTGMRGFLHEGMWGTFLEPSGRPRHACIRKLVIHPMSVRDAVISPFRMLAEAIRRTAGWSGTVRGLMTPATPVGTLPHPPVADPAPAAAPTAAGILAVGAGAGLALAALSSALTYLSDRFVAAATAVGAWLRTLPGFTPLDGSPDHASYPLAVAFVACVVVIVPVAVYLVPVSIAAWVRLRRRDLGTLLVGSGWAVNTPLHLTGELERRLTVQAKSPNSRGEPT